MPLIESKLKLDLKNLMKEMTTFEDQEKGLDHFSGELAKIITSYIKSATVTVQPGILVSTAGSAVAQTGATTSTGTTTIS